MYVCMYILYVMSVFLLCLSSLVISRSLDSWKGEEVRAHTRPLSSACLKVHKLDTIVDPRFFNLHLNSMSNYNSTNNLIR